jgi:hypothetical protein
MGLCSDGRVIKRDFLREHFKSYLKVLVVGTFLLSARKSVVFVAVSLYSAVFTCDSYEVLSNACWKCSAKVTCNVVVYLI